jgi:hypothetical protein
MAEQPPLFRGNVGGAIFLSMHREILIRTGSQRAFKSATKIRWVRRDEPKEGFPPCRPASTIQ